MKFKFQWEWLYPLLFGAFPVLFIYSHNIDQLLMEHLWRPLLFSEIMAFLFLLGFAGITKNMGTGCFLSFIFTTLFFSYGHVHSLFGSWFIRAFGWGLGRIQVPVWFVLLGLGVYLAIKHPRFIERVTRPLFVAGLILVLLPGYKIFSHERDLKVSNKAVSDLGSALENFAASEVQEDIKLRNANIPPKSLPDIYFIVPDRYPGNSVLENHFGFSNREFTDFLRDNNFLVLDSVRANYLGTVHSLSSVLNLEHHFNTRDWGDYTTPPNKVFANRIKNNRIAELLKSMGYQYILVGSWWWASQRSPLADISYFNSYGPGVFNSIMYDEFFVKLIRTTWAFAFLKYSLPLSSNQNHRRIGLEQFKALPHAISQKGPKFVFCHLLLPHGPYVFDSEGKRVSGTDLASIGEDSLFINQLRYTNSKLKETVQYIFQSSKRPVLIVLMADEGTTPQKNPQNNTDERLMHQTRMEVFCALYGPGLDSTSFDFPLTSVNVFRNLFNQYFGTDYKTLSNNNFALKYGSAPKEITHFWNNGH